jgi:hypothetical protein
MKYWRREMNKKNLFVVLLAMIGVSAYSINLNQLRIIASDGTFLGTFENEYSSNSIYNQYGRYGSPYNTNSIFNKYGTYGSDYSNKSPFNQYANNAPGLYDSQGNFYGTLSINQYARGVTNDSRRIALQLKAIRDSM